MKADFPLLDALRQEIRPLKSSVCPIHPRTGTSISLVGTDGGNVQLQFDPFMIQLIRVVDSSNNQYHLEAVTPSMPLEAIDQRHFSQEGLPTTAFGEMMAFLGVQEIRSLSHLIREDRSGIPSSSTWVGVYRELVEWATVFSLLNKDFGTDTLIVCDHLLRSLVFADDLFIRLMQGFEQRIEAQWKRNRRKIYLVGIAKHSKVLTRYRLVMKLEGILQTNYPAFVTVPKDVEERAYYRTEHGRQSDWISLDDSVTRHVGGKMFLVKFGSRPRDPIWPVDLFLPQLRDTKTILAWLLGDAVNGFPVPFYPNCIQKAHENASLSGFDLDILQDCVFEGIRKSLDGEADLLDTFRLLDEDVSRHRYD